MLRKTRAAALITGVAVIAGAAHLGGRLSAAGWPHVFGSPGSVATSVQADSSGDAWVAGRLQGAGLWVARLGPRGDVRWQRHYPPSGPGGAPVLAVLRGGAWVAAEVLGPQLRLASGGTLPASTAWLRCLDGNGLEVRRAELRQGRTNQPQALLGQEDGGVLVAGEISHGDDSRSRGWLARLEADGRVRWERVLPEVWWLSAVQRLPNGRVLALGTAPGVGEGDPEGRPWLGTLTADGRVETSRTLEVVGVHAQAVLAAGGDAWVAGQQVPPPSPQAADALGVGRRAWLARVPLTGGAVEDIPLLGMRDAHAVTRDRAGLIYVGGEGSSALDPSATEEPWVAIIDSAGHVVRRGRAEGTTGHGALRAMAATAEGVLGAGALVGRGAWVGNTLSATTPVRK